MHSRIEPTYFTKSVIANVFLVADLHFWYKINFADYKKTVSQLTIRTQLARRIDPLKNTMYFNFYNDF